MATNLFPTYAGGSPITSVIGSVPTTSSQLSTAGSSLLPSLPSLPQLPSLGSIANQIPGVQTVTGVAGGASKFFDAVTSADFWERAIFIILGMVMIALALFFFAKHDAVKIVAGTVKEAAS